jgi:hypothetical protein
MKNMIIASPLFTDWTEQYVRLHLADTAPGAPLALTVNGQSTPFQYTGAASAAGKEILVKLGFAKGERKVLVFEPAEDKAEFGVRRLDAAFPSRGLTPLSQAAA